MRSKIAQLSKIYHEFEKSAAPFKISAACRRGCAYCCTNAGRIDITTLEGLAMRDVIDNFPRPRRQTIRKALVLDLKRHEQGQTSPCPLLMKSRACMIYTARPFACRRIYSLKTCDPNQPPVLHRQVMDLGVQTIQALQQLDHTGYSGHLSFILHMLEAPEFLSTYQAGEFAPREMLNFGRAHNIVINHMAAPGLDGG